MSGKLKRPYEEIDGTVSNFTDKKAKIKSEIIDMSASGKKDNKTLSLVRRVFAVLRHPQTTPDTELPDGQIAGLYATQYILASHHNRSTKKEKT